MQTKKINLFFLLTIIFLFLFLRTEIECKNFLPSEDEYILTAEKMPSPIGGLEGIMKRITYPEIAVRMKTEGKVYLLVFVNESGDVDDVKIVKGIGNGCDEEAARAVKRTKFNPGTDKGVPVKTKYSFAVTFKL